MVSKHSPSYQCLEGKEPIYLCYFLFRAAMDHTWRALRLDSHVLTASLSVGPSDPSTGWLASLLTAETALCLYNFQGTFPGIVSVAMESPLSCESAAVKSQKDHTEVGRPFLSSVQQFTLNPFSFHSYLLRANWEFSSNWQHLCAWPCHTCFTFINILNLHNGPRT